MGQGDVINAMKNGEWCTAKEISERIDLRKQSVSRNLARLYKWREVLRRRRKTIGRGNEYEYQKKE